jgi:hypothetical protein
MNKVTMGQLEVKVERLNNLAVNYDLPHEFVLSGAYGGWSLHMNDRAGKGYEVAIDTGYVSKRELAFAIDTFTAGIRYGIRHGVTRRMEALSNEPS